VADWPLPLLPAALRKWASGENHWRQLLTQMVSDEMSARIERPEQRGGKADGNHPASAGCNRAAAVCTEQSATAEQPSKTSSSRAVSWGRTIAPLQKQSQRCPQSSPSRGWAGASRL